MNLKKLKDIVDSAYDFAKNGGLDTSKVEVDSWLNEDLLYIKDIRQSSIDGRLNIILGSIEEIDEDNELRIIVEDRKNQPGIKVDLDEL